MASTFTRRRNFEKPGDGDADWDVPTNANTDKFEEELIFSSSKFRNQQHGQNTFSSIQRWEQIAMNSAQGAAAVSLAYVGTLFDGRYMYFTPHNSDTFVRYDTVGRFRDIASWEQLAMSSGQGAAALDTAYREGIFDGRYIYFAPANSDTFVRYDTTGIFTDITFWAQMAMNSAQGAAAVDLAYNTASFDGRFLYFTPENSDTFIQYDTAGSFTAIASWDQVAMSSAQGAAALNGAYVGVTFDGRHIYFAPSQSDTLIRYDTTAAFDAIASWEQLEMSSGLGGTAAIAHNGACFDGRHVYYIARDANTFARFDTAGTFTDITNWEQIAMSSALGAAAVDGATSGVAFDGRYVYPGMSVTPNTYIRYDTTETFTDITSWEQVEQSSAHGGATSPTSVNPGFDGYYIYFAPVFASTFIRFRANTTPNSGPTEYDQVSS